MFLGLQYFRALIEDNADIQTITQTQSIQGKL